MKKDLIAGLVIVLVAGAFIGGHLLGRNSAWNEAYSQGHDEGFKKGAQGEKHLGEMRSQELEAQLDGLTKDYNGLVEKYNQLARTPVYQPRQSINCTTSELGSSLYTNCY